MKKISYAILLFACSLIMHTAQASDKSQEWNFERITEWKNLWIPWSREENKITATQEKTEKENSEKSVKAVKISYNGEQDWSLFLKDSARVKAGEKYQLKVSLKIQSVETDSKIWISVSTWDTNKKTIDLLFGKTPVDRASTEWQEVTTEFTIPENVTSVSPRISGQKPATLLIEHFTLTHIKKTENSENTTLGLRENNEEKQP